MNNLPTPHGDKLRALVSNEKLPSEDLPRVRQAIEHYEKWLQEMGRVRGTYSEIIEQMVSFELHITLISKRVLWQKHILPT